MTKKLLSIFLALALVLIMAPVALAVSAADGIEFVSLGTAAPPAELGGYELIPAINPGFEPMEVVAAVPTFLGDISFVSEANITARYIPDDGWSSSWSHGYADLVFFSEGSDTVTIVLPAGAKAFVVYAEPNIYDVFDITVQANDGTEFTEAVEILPPGQGRDDAGAYGFGFYSTGDADIATVTISTELGAEGFAFGEMAVGAGQAETTTAAEPTATAHPTEATVATTATAPPTDTGDNMPLALMAVLMVSGAAALLVVFKARKARA